MQIQVMRRFKPGEAWVDWRINLLEELIPQFNLLNLKEDECAIVRGTQGDAIQLYYIQKKNKFICLSTHVSHFHITGEQNES